MRCGEGTTWATQPTAGVRRSEWRSQLCAACLHGKDVEARVKRSKICRHSNHAQAGPGMGGGKGEENEDKEEEREGGSKERSSCEECPVRRLRGKRV